MNFENLIVKIDGNVATVTINRPEKRNALNRATRIEIYKIFDSLFQESAVHVVVITGAGDRSFVSGADVDEIAGIQPEETRKFAHIYSGFWRSDFVKPVIGMINGYAIGGGCELALACDIRMASDNAKFSLPEIKLGMFPGWGGTQRLPRLIGEAKAMELILTGEAIGAEEALRLGLVNHVFSQSELPIKTMAMARTIATMGPIAMKLAKQSVRNASEMNLSSGLEAELELFCKNAGTEDRNEGIRAFLEKRVPRFKGR